MEKKTKILIVDDDPLILESLKDTLEIEGFEPFLSSKVYEGIEIIKKEKIDLVITDIKMPEVSGIEFLRMIREISLDIPVIIITGFASLDTAIEAIREGAYDYIIKPFEVEKLIAIIKRALNEKILAEKNKSLIGELQETAKELNKRLQQLFHLDKVSRVICSEFELEEFLGNLLNTTTQALNAKIGSLMLFDDKEEYLHVKAIKGLDEDFIKTVKLKKGEGIPGLVAEKGRIISSKDIEEEGIRLNKIDQGLFRFPNFISVPIYGKNRVWGVLNLSGWDKDFNFSEIDLKLLNILVSQAWIALENSRLNGELQNSYLHTLRILANAIEAKCKYTRGHSERVTRYAVKFAKEIRLSEREIRKIQFACEVHDIGKINISDAILNKTTPLDKREWEIIKEHPTKGVEILIPLGILKELIPLVKHHHERFDGKGYPENKKGNEIPLETRIITLLDAYDAMTSDRPYRERMSKEEALKEIEKNLGTHFDPDLGERFIKLHHLFEIKE